MSDDTQRAMTRRTALLATGTLLGVIPASASAARIPAAPPSNAATATPTATYELGADLNGWVGQSPGSIEGVTNPTLEMIPGETYEVIYENLDGITHDFQILDTDGSTVVDGDEVSDSGDTNSVQFTASEEMTDYRCRYHPSSMVGTVATEGPSAATTTSTETPTPTTTDSPSPTRSAAGTPTDTSTTTDGSTATGTSTPTDAATGTSMATATPTEPAAGTRTSAGTETTTVATPGFGIWAAVVALLTKIVLELRDD